MSETLTSLDLGISNAISYKIHPSVVVNILDVYYRNTTKPWILGVLLGNIYPNYVKITNVVFVPSSIGQNQEIGVDNDYLNRLLHYNDKIFNESRVGWFITKNTIDTDVATLHKHLLPSLKTTTSTFAGPLIMLVDATLETEKIKLSGFISQPNKMFRECVALFQPIKVDVELFDADLSTGQLLYGNLDKSTHNKNKQRGLTFNKSLEEAKENITTLKEKLSQMTPEQLSEYPELVREVKSLLASRFGIVNDNNSQAIDQFVEDNHHLRYLTDIAQIQLIIAEKLSNKVELSD